MTLKRTTISLSEPVLIHYKGVAHKQRRSLSSIIEERLKNALAAKPAARKRGTTLRKGERV